MSDWRPPSFSMLTVPQPIGTVLTSLGKDVIAHALSLGATAVLAEEVTLPDGRVLPINTPMRQREDGYWEVAE